MHNSTNPRTITPALTESSTAFKRIYRILAVADTLNDEKGDLNGDICVWLNRNGFCNLTVCPTCYTDDFSHVAGCPVSAQVQAQAKVIEASRR